VRKSSIKLLDEECAECVSMSVSSLYFQCHYVNDHRIVNSYNSVVNGQVVFCIFSGLSVAVAASHGTYPSAWAGCSRWSAGSRRSAVRQTTAGKLFICSLSALALNIESSKDVRRFHGKSRSCQVESPDRMILSQSIVGHLLSGDWVGVRLSSIESNHIRCWD